MDSADIAIIGGGAAGLTAAIFAAESSPGRRIIVLDGASVLGAKILVSGGGRCNVTHDHVHVSDFNGNKNIVRNVLAAFDAAATVKWFASMGVELKLEETGKLFPVSNSARTVLNALVTRCNALGVTIQIASKVAAIEPGDSGFTLKHAAGTQHAVRLIMATGGKSLPRSGSDGSGWEIVRGLGHTVTDTHMALVPLVLQPNFIHAELSGIALEVELTTLVANKPIDRRGGSLLFTHFGLSGPVAMDASRHWIIAGNAEMHCNLLPGENLESIEKRLLAEVTRRPKAHIVTCLGGLFPERVALAILRHSGIDPATPAGQISREQRRLLGKNLVALPLPIAQPRGWNYAEVTAGGVPLNEIDYRTMASRRVPGLYLAGEILDCDGRIGGFNFQWAWATGFLAGRAAASS